MKKKTFEYSGRENLEAVAQAHNYNSSLINLVLKGIAYSNKKNPKLLDFGAGSGTYADMLKKYKIGVECLEPDEILRNTLKKKGYTTQINSSTLKPETYDVIYAINVMEHIKNDSKEINQLLAALKKDGILIIYVPAFKILFSSMDALVGHYRRYRTSDFEKYITKKQVEIMYLGYADPLGFLVTLAYRAIGSRKGTVSTSSVKIYDKLIFPLSRFLEPATKKLFGKNVAFIARKL